MKNLSTKVTLLLAICTLAAAQVSASPLFSSRVEKNDCQISKSMKLYTKAACFKTWFLSQFNKKDYVAEDSLLDNYMLGRADKLIKLSDETELSLLSNYMYGGNSEVIVYANDSEYMSFAFDLEDEDICKNDFIEE